MAERKTEKRTQQISCQNSFEIATARWIELWACGKSPRMSLPSPRYGDSPCPGARPVAEIEAPELLAMIKAIEDRGVRNIAKRARETTGQIFRYAIAQGYSRLNPVAEFRASDILSPPTSSTILESTAETFPIY
jgi:integrase